MVICFEVALANTKLVWIISSMKVDIEVKSCKFLKNIDCQILNLPPCLNGQDLISYKYFFAFTWR